MTTWKFELIPFIKLHKAKIDFEHSQQL